MSILDALKGLAGGEGAGSGNPTLDLIGGLIQKSGGVGGLVSALQRGGLGGVVDSWVGTGRNQQVSPDQLERVFGRDQVQDMAQDAGMPTDGFLSQLSRHLPRVVDGMTPNGRMPDDETISV